LLKFVYREKAALPPPAGGLQGNEIIHLSVN